MEEPKEIFERLREEAQPRRTPGASDALSDPVRAFGRPSLARDFIPRVEILNIYMARFSVRALGLVG